MGARAALRHSAAVDVFANDPRPQSVAILLALTLWFNASTLNLIILERPRPICGEGYSTLVRAFLPRSGGRSAIASVPTCKPGTTFRQCRVVLAYTSFRNEPDISGPDPAPRALGAAPLCR